MKKVKANLLLMGSEKWDTKSNALEDIMLLHNLQTKHSKQKTQKRPYG
jgi:hypothetical protein